MEWRGESYDTFTIRSEREIKAEEEKKSEERKLKEQQRREGKKSKEEARIRKKAREIRKEELIQDPEFLRQAYEKMKSEEKESILEQPEKFILWKYLFPIILQKFLSFF